jgi:adenylate cyclase
MALLASKRKTQIVMMGDVVGYSRLMETDEDDTHSRMQQINAEVIGPILAEHAGSLVKETGDGFLATFDTPTLAIRSAIALQTALIKRASGFPPERRIIFRLALNICDVIIEDSDIYGDGVNITARLQTYAEPGDIIMTAVLAQLASRELISFNTFDLGELHLKNISRAIHAFGVRIGSLHNLTAPALLNAADARPSIAVLPFNRPSGAQTDAYLADAIVEEVIHGLAAAQGLFVISRGSTKHYEGKNTDARKVGKELNVRYVLNGSVQRAGDKLRIGTELVDADTGLIIRHDRFDGRVAELFQLQEQIAVNVMKTVAPNIL